MFSQSILKFKGSNGTLWAEAGGCVVVTGVSTENGCNSGGSTVSRVQREPCTMFEETGKREMEFKNVEWH